MMLTNMPPLLIFWFIVICVGFGGLLVIKLDLLLVKFIEWMINGRYQE
jgi:hypothetical protein